MANPFDQFDAAPAKAATSANPFDAFDNPTPSAASTGFSTLETLRNGLATAPINAYLGVKQFFGGLSPEEQKVLAQNHAAEKSAPVTSFASNLLTAIPTMFIPGANTVAGAGVVGALNGLTQPTEGDQTLGSIASGKFKNMAIGGALGAVGQFGANKIAGALQTKLTSAEANAADDASRNSVRDATLSAGREAGYVVPNSEVAPSFLGNRLESLGGKAAIKQQATAENQQVTNALARKALGVPGDAPLSAQLLGDLRSEHGKVYQAVADLSETAAKDLEALKQARFDAKAQYNFYNRSANPEALTAAKSADVSVNNLEDQMFMHAINAGKPELMPALRDARKGIAQTYTVERALNPATGDISAPTLARIYAKGQPLSDGLETIGQFGKAFPKFTGNAATNPAAGVGKSEMLAASLMAMAGHATAGPAGLLAGALPLAAHGARNLALAKALQKVPDYSLGNTASLASKITPENLGLLGKALAGYLPAQ